MVALVNFTGPTTGSSLTTLNVTIPATGSGNTLVICITESSSGATNPNVTGITLGASSTGWAAAKTSLSNSTVNSEIWKCGGIAGGQTAVVITMANGAGTANTCAYVYEVSGLTGAVDQVAGADNTTGSTLTVSSGATPTTTAANEFWVGVAYNYWSSAPGVFTNIGAWTNETQQAQTGAAATESISGYQIVSSTGAATYSVTAAHSSGWSACCVTFTGSAGTPVSPVTPYVRPVPPRWFPGSDKVVTAPGQIPFAIPATPSQEKIAVSANINGVGAPVSAQGGIGAATGYEVSPYLEVYGFGTFPAIGASDTINSVSVAINEFQATPDANSITFQLWDGTSAQIGTDHTGIPNTGTGNLTTATFTGISYAQLATLRVRIYSTQPIGSGHEEFVDAVTLSVNSTPFVNTPANITGAAASVTLAGGIGTISSSANITGIAAQITVTGGAGTPAGAGSVTGIGASVTVQGGTGFASAGGSVNVAGVGAPVPVAGGIGSVSASANVVGIGAQVSVQSGTGTVKSSAALAGIAAQITVQGGTGTASGSGAASITGVAAQVQVTGGTGTPQGGAVVTGVAAQVTVSGGTGHTAIPKLATLTDSFGASSIDSSKWTAFTNNGATVTESGGTLNCAIPGTTNAWAGLVSGRAYDLTGSSAYLAVPAYANFGNSYAILALCSQGTPPSGSPTGSLQDFSGSGVPQFMWALQSGQLGAIAYSASANTQPANLVFDPVQHKFWRIREASGTVNWDTSPDGLAWANQGSVATSFIGAGLAGSLFAWVYAWNFSGGSGGTTRFADFNTPAVVPNVKGSATATVSEAASCVASVTGNSSSASVTESASIRISVTGNSSTSSVTESASSSASVS